MAKSIQPFLMFQGDVRAEGAMRFYVSLFPGSQITRLERYGAEQPEKAGLIFIAEFVIAGQRIRCTDSVVKHKFGFTPAMSLVINCESKEEIERLTPLLADGGAELMPLGSYGLSQQFAWINDRYGVSWQLILP